MEKKVVKINENQLSKMIAESIEEALGYDMSTPEGRRGAEDWMNYIMDQEDRRPAIAAKNWSEEHGLGWDENVIEAFIAGVEYGRELN